MSYKKHHKKQSKERILESASQLFCQFGYKKVSISQVMKLARMTHGAFYAHFESKEALYKTSLVDVLQRNRSNRLAKSPFTINHLMELVNNLTNLRAIPKKSNPSPENVLFNEIGNESNEIKGLYEKSYHSLLTLLEKRIKALKKLKQLPNIKSPEHVKGTSRVILAIMVGAVAIAKSIQSDTERQILLLAAQNQVLSLLGDSNYIEQYITPLPERV
ncbi:TetR/AcrR family transcriptional regulator [Marinicellulosiphila megalodicopiae]|uniref:TetR/AcrR family transcriptional regulator n=1 Tax=Marinicellulosiphila megalodicopiae TaxID=2724896 RepID=UPI003BAF2D97